MYCTNTNNKKLGIATLISDKADFSVRKHIHYTEGIT